MSVLAAAALALIVGPARAARAPTGLEASCKNEIRLLCPGLGRPALLRCLDDHEDDLMTACRLAFLSQRQQGESEPEEPAEPVEPAEPGEPAAAPPAARTASAATLPSRGKLRDARLIGVLGDVFLHLSGRPADQYVAVSSGAPLAAGDALRVGPRAAAELAFDGTTLVSLSSGTSLSVTSLSRDETELGLTLGGLSAKIEGLGSAETFRIRTPAAVAAVRGTELLVEQDSSGASRVGVVEEGRVEVTAGAASVVLGPRQETAVPPGQAPQPARALASLRARADAFASVRARAADAAKGWRPMPYAGRRAARRRLAAEQPLSSAPASPSGSPPATAPGVPIHLKGAEQGPGRADKRGH